MYVLALDQGTTIARARFSSTPSGTAVASQAHEFKQHYPAAGLGRARSRARSGTRSCAAARARCARRRCARRRRRGDRHHEPARDDGRLGARDRPRRSTARSCGSRARRAPICDELRARGLEPTVRARTGPGDRRVLLGDEGPLHPRRRSTGARERASAASSRSGRSTRWLSAQLTGGRVHATEYSNAVAHACSTTSHGADWDDRAAAQRSTSRAQILPEVRDSSGVFGTADPSWFGARGPDRGHRGRPAGRALRPGAASTARAAPRTPTAPAASLLMNTGRACARSHVGPDLDDRLGHRRPASSTRSRAAVVRRGRGGAVAARRARAARTARPRARRSRAPVPDTGGVYLVPAFTGLGAPYWDPNGARHDRGHHARDQPRAPGARHARGDRLRDAPTSCAARARHRRARDPAPGRRRRHRERLPHAVPGRRHGIAGAAPQGARDDRARRRVSGRPRGRLLKPTAARSRRTGRRTATSSLRDSRPAAPSVYGGWLRAVERARAGRSPRRDAEHRPPRRVAGCARRTRSRPSTWRSSRAADMIETGSPPAARRRIALYHDDGSAERRSARSSLAGASASGCRGRRLLQETLDRCGARIPSTWRSRARPTGDYPGLEKRVLHEIAQRRSSGAHLVPRSFRTRCSRSCASSSRRPAWERSSGSRQPGKPIRARVARSSAEAVHLHVRARERDGARRDAHAAGLRR